jgi:ribosomal protein S18 acetylase RimI-like enzyme
MPVVIREMDRTDAADCAAVSAIDTSFETRSIYDVVCTPAKLELVERALPAPRVKGYSMAEAFAEWSSWDTGYVADVAGAIVGFAGVEYEAWHQRLVLWHLYVAPAHRRTGVGRALLARCEADGAKQGARRVWLETSSVNVPGIAAYARLGYTLCGADTTEYDGLPYADEAALYLSKLLRE